MGVMRNTGVLDQSIRAQNQILGMQSHRGVHGGVLLAVWARGATTIRNVGQERPEGLPELVQCSEVWPERREQVPIGEAESLGPLCLVGYPGQYNKGLGDETLLHVSWLPNLTFLPDRTPEDRATAGSQQKDGLISQGPSSRVPEVPHLSIFGKFGVVGAGDKSVGCVVGLQQPSGDPCAQPL